LRSIPKYVVSSTLDDAPEWTNSTVLKGDVTEDVTKLKQNVDGNILVYASAPLVQTLIEHDLIDEMRLMIHPFILGTGERLFREANAMKALRRVDVRTIGASLALLTYQPVRNA
jgi:dihydrofolate reductase